MLGEDLKVSDQSFEDFAIRSLPYVVVELGLNTRP